MQPEDLNVVLSRQGLNGIPKDREAVRTLLTPYFENLWESKLIYFERFMCIAKIESMTFTPELFEARAHASTLIEQGMHRPINWKRLENGWTFSSRWEELSYGNRSFGMPYTSVVFIIDHDLVKQAETLAREGKHRDVVKLIYDCI